MPSRDPQHEAQSLRRILEVARQLAAPFELRDLLAQVIDAGRDVLSAERGSVFLYDPASRELYTVVAHGVQGIRFSADKGIAGECARNRTIINVPDCYADPRFNQAIDKQTGYRTRCMITVPLVGLDDELVGVLQLLNSSHECFDGNDEYLAVLIASQAATAIQRVKLMSDRLERLKLERELDLARKIQMGVLPTELPPCPGYELATYSNPADETGGDIFDVIAIDYTGRSAQRRECDPADYRMPDTGLFLLLADATGHGIGPALSVTQVRAMLRVGLRLAAGLPELFRHINSQLSMDLSSDRFVTAFMGVLDPVRHELMYISGGQGPLLHFHAADGSCDFLEASTVPMGIMDDPPIDLPGPMVLAPGDMVVLLTDGFYEFQNAAGKMLGKERLGEVVAQHRRDSAQQVLDALLKEVADFADGAPQLDDVTGVIVKRL
jgi:phosphoserine phosphatase